MQGRTIYESESRRRNRRVRDVVVAATAVTLAAATLGVTAVWMIRGDSTREGEASAAASRVSSPSASSSAQEPRLARLRDVEAHQGQTATFRYRLMDGPAGTTVTLVVRDAAGVRVKARRLPDADAGRSVSAEVPLDLQPGRYTYALVLGNTAGSASVARSSDVTASAELLMLAPLPPGFPGRKAVAAARDWIAARDGDVAFAVVDTNGADAGGYRRHEPFQLASLSKAILLVAALRNDPTPDPATEATLTSMITESDNGAGFTIFGQVGAEGMQAVATAAGMQDYEQGAGWLETRASAADQAHFFSQLDSLVPAEGRELARTLLASVIPIQRWGIPAAAGPEGWTSYHKGGWLGLDNKLMVQAAWLEKGKKRWALAVMSDENPTRSYGWDTQKGVTGLLLGEEPAPAYLAVVLE